MTTHVPPFLDRFGLTFFREDSCIEYFLTEIGSMTLISYSLVLSYSRTANRLHVSRFHPELFLQPASRYMSAVCFYLMIHHCAAEYNLDDASCISLETRPDIHARFYRRLKDFNFHIDKKGLGDVVELVSEFRLLPVDTTMIKASVFSADESPFLV